MDTKLSVNSLPFINNTEFCYSYCTCETSEVNNQLLVAIYRSLVSRKIHIEGNPTLNEFIQKIEGVKNNECNTIDKNTNFTDEELIARVLLLIPNLIIKSVIGYNLHHFLINGSLINMVHADFDTVRIYGNENHFTVRIIILKDENNPDKKIYGFCPFHFAWQVEKI